MAVICHLLPICFFTSIVYDLESFYISMKMYIILHYGILAGSLVLFFSSEWLKKSKFILFYLTQNHM